MPPRRKRSKLTTKQKAQRKYASQMRAVRGRAATTARGRGRIETRRAATTLRRKYGLKSGR
jgi:hypothetical protein